MQDAPGQAKQDHSMFPEALTKTQLKLLSAPFAPLITLLIETHVTKRVFSPA